MAQDVRVKRTSPTQGRFGGGPRGEVTALSRGSRRRLSLTARNLEGLTHMLTLTYPGEFPTDGRRVKRDWSAMREFLKRQHLGGFWFLEFQQRGAPHYHVFLTGGVDKTAVRAAWGRIISEGHSNVTLARTRIERLRVAHAAGAYASKYAAKMEQKAVPDEYLGVGRFWGRFGGLEVVQTTVASGLAEDVAPLTRVVRQAFNGQRATWQNPRGDFHDEGRRSFTAYGVGPCIREYLSKGGMTDTAERASATGGASEDGSE